MLNNFLGTLRLLDSLGNFGSWDFATNFVFAQDILQYNGNITDWILVAGVNYSIGLIWFPLLIGLFTIKINPIIFQLTMSLFNNLLLFFGLIFVIRELLLEYKIKLNKLHVFIILLLFNLVYFLNVYCNNSATDGILIFQRQSCYIAIDVGVWLFCVGCLFRYFNNQNKRNLIIYITLSVIILSTSMLPRLTFFIPFTAVLFIFLNLTNGWKNVLYNKYKTIFYINVILIFICIFIYHFLTTYNVDAYLKSGLHLPLQTKLYRLFVENIWNLSIKPILSPSLTLEGLLHMLFCSIYWIVFFFAIILFIYLISYFLKRIISLIFFKTNSKFILLSIQKYEYKNLEFININIMLLLLTIVLSALLLTLGILYQSSHCALRYFVYIVLLSTIVCLFFIIKNTSLKYYKISLIIFFHIFILTTLYFSVKIYGKNFIKVKDIDYHNTYSAQLAKCIIENKEKYKLDIGTTDFHYAKGIYSYMRYVKSDIQMLNAVYQNWESSVWTTNANFLHIPLNRKINFIMQGIWKEDAYGSIVNYLNAFYKKPYTLQAFECVDKQIIVLDDDVAEWLTHGYNPYSLDTFYYSYKNNWWDNSKKLYRQQFLANILPIQNGKIVGENVVSNGFTGVFTYGPYAKLKKGKYKAVIKYRIDKLTQSGVSPLSIDSVYNQGKDIIIPKMPINIGKVGEIQTQEIEFELSHKIQDFELRTYLDDNSGQFTLYNFAIIKI